MLFPDPKPGDEVAYSRSWRDEPRKLTIERTTPTQVLVCGLRFRRSDGEQIGASWDSARIKPWTEELEAEIERRREAERAATRLREARSRGRAAMERLLDLFEVEQVQVVEALADELERRAENMMDLRRRPADAP